MFDRMYHKRLKAYKQIGYEIYPESESCFNETNSIFDIDTYAEVYNQDLLTASKEIILSSPAISGRKVNELLALLSERQERGLRVIVVTCAPYRYRYGDSAYWFELHERMRRSGLEVNLTEDYCECFCVIDRKVVWYGSMNFLGKEDAEDNLMRVCSEHIANELLELTFGGKKGDTILEE